MTKRVLVTGGSGFIGTHLMNLLLAKGHLVLNIDIFKPKLESHIPYWKHCDIKNHDKLLEISREFSPAHVFHLAAKANLNGATIDDFPDNVVGTDNVVACVNELPSIRRFIHISTQYVVAPGVFPESDEFLQPYTAYGESKAEGERIVRRRCRKPWVIARPTNIWGPYHPAFPYEMWPYLERRLYFHPGYKPTIKYYGYVENAVWQLYRLGVDIDEDKVCGRVFYITDPPINNLDWLDGFSLALSGKPARRIPRFLWRMLAYIGDLAKAVGLKVPISSDRFFRLTVNERIPYQRTIDMVGSSQISLEEGIRRSVNWYKNQKLQGKPIT